MTFLITGVSGGIGNYLFNCFKTNSQIVFGTFNRNKPIDIIDDQNISQVDLTDFDKVKIWSENLDLEKKQIVLINCTGINYNRSFHKTDPNLWKQTFEVNLFGTYNLMRNIIPYMRENKFGRIINFSSIVAQKLTPGTSAYSASKSALWGLCRSVASENAKENITVNNINLGYFETGMIKDVPKEFQEIMLEQIPTNRFGKLHEIYNTVKYIIDTPYLNGTSIDLNGGLY